MSLKMGCSGKPAPVASQLAEKFTKAASTVGSKSIFKPPSKKSDKATAKLAEDKAKVKAVDDQEKLKGRLNDKEEVILAKKENRMAKASAKKKKPRASLNKTKAPARRVPRKAASKAKKRISKV